MDRDRCIGREPSGVLDYRHHSNCRMLASPVEGATARIPRPDRVNPIERQAAA